MLLNVACEHDRLSFLRRCEGARAQAAFEAAALTPALEGSMSMRSPTSMRRPPGTWFHEGRSPGGRAPALADETEARGAPGSLAMAAVLAPVKRNRAVIVRGW